MPVAFGIWIMLFAEIKIQKIVQYTNIKKELKRQILIGAYYGNC